LGFLLHFVFLNLLDGLLVEESELGFGRIKMKFEADTNRTLV
jgi:hypothetical protein